MQQAGIGAPSHGATWQARPVGAIVPALLLLLLLRAPALAPDTARAMAPVPTTTGPVRPGTITGVRRVLPRAAASAVVPSVVPAEAAPLGAVPSAAEALAAVPLAEWAAAEAMAAAVAADGNAAVRQ